MGADAEPQVRSSAWVSELGQEPRSYTAWLVVVNGLLSSAGEHKSRERLLLQRTEIVRDANGSARGLYLYHRRKRREVGRQITASVAAMRRCSPASNG